MQTFSDYQRNVMDQSAPGLIVDSSGVIDRIYRTNSGRSTDQVIAPLTVGGTIGTETFTITIAGYSAIAGAYSIPIAVTAASGDTATAVAGKLVAAISANEVLNDLMTASNAAGVITLAVLPGQKVDSVAGSATGSATLTASPTLTPGAETPLIPYGFAVGCYPSYTDSECSLPNTGTDLTILGVAVRRYYHEARYPYSSADMNGYPARADVEILRKGKIWVPVPSNVVRDTQAAILPTTGQWVANGAPSSTPVAGAMYREKPNKHGHTVLDLNLP